MLLKEEFTANLSYLEPSINAMLYAGEGEQSIDCFRRCDSNANFLLLRRTIKI